MFAIRFLLNLVVFHRCIRPINPGPINQCLVGVLASILSLGGHLIPGTFSKYNAHATKKPSAKASGKAIKKTSSSSHRMIQIVES